MISFDTETTGFPLNDGVPLAKQPQIIEFAAIKFDPETLEVIDRLEFLANPGKPLPDKIVEITGITDEMLKDEKPFEAYYPDLVKFYLGETTSVAHNHSFDLKMMTLEMQRMDKVLRFPWPARNICTVEKSYSIKGHRLKLKDLYEIATGKKFVAGHRAMPDTEALFTCYKYLREQGLTK